MFLAFIAFVMAFFALLRTRDLSDRIKRLESDRDEAMTRLATLQKLVERLRTQTVAVTKEAEKAVEPPTQATPAISTPIAPPAAPPDVAPAAAAPPVSPCLLYTSDAADE